MTLRVNGIASALREFGVPWWRVAGMVALSLSLMLVEGAGVGLLLPVLVWVEQGPAALHEDPSGFLHRLVDVLAWVGLPMALWPLLLIAFLPFIARQALYAANLAATAKLAQGAVAHLRRRAFDAFMQADMSFHVGSRRSELASALTVDAARVSHALTSAINLAGAAILVAGYAALLCFMSWRLTLLAIPLFAALAIVFGHRSRLGLAWGARIGAATTELARHVGDALAGIRLVKLRGAEGRMSALAAAAAERVATSVVTIERARGVIEASSHLLLMAITFAIFYVAVTQLGMRLATLGLFVFVVTRMVPQLIAINSHRMVLNSHIGGLQTIRALVGAADRVGPRVAATRPFPGMQQEIRFERVAFSYGPEAAPALQGINLTISRGDSFALAGRSGAGKSTLIDLLVGLQRPSDGRILVDGVPVDSYDAVSYRKRIGFVPQETVLFNDSVRANLVFGMAQAPSDEAIWAALRQVNADEFVERLAGQLDAVIGEGGAALSGGQRQRLGLARALVQDPELLILDEPTSALDSVSEAAIQHTLQALRGRVTVITIAHRLATIRHSDHIFVLDEGRLVAEGTHGRLMADSAPYRRLFGGQAGLLDTEALA